MRLPDHIPEELSAEVFALATRLGPEEFSRRLAHEQRLRQRRGRGQGKGLFRFEHCFDLYGCIRLSLKAAGLWRRGLRNYLDIRVVQREVHLPRLPCAFDGYTILQLTDLHADLHPDFSERVAQVIAGLQSDRLVVTGDFRTCTYGDHSGATAASIEILRDVQVLIQAILGNHDFLTKVPLLEAAGLQFLLNEHMLIERDGASLALIGIDDSSFYRTHNFARAMDGLDADVCKILLTHSPNTALEAARRGIDFLLAGHTHGGQICLPGGIPVMVDAGLSRRHAVGSWSAGRMQGYTSRGTGATACRFA